MKKYETHQKNIIPKPEKPEKSDVGCTEKKCKGEMMIIKPYIKHPQLPLKRAICKNCGWRGWV